MLGNSSVINNKSPTMIGILSEYDPEILTTNKISKHFALDIDNKKFFFLYKEKINEIEDIMCLYNYIKDCTENIIKSSQYSKYDEKDDFKDSIDLYECIKILMDELIRRAKKVTAVDYNKSNGKPNFFKLYNDESEMDCIQINKKLLKTFYLFTIQIIKKFMIFKYLEEDENIDDNESISESRVPSFVINIKEEKNIRIEEESPKLKEKRELARKAGHVFREKFRNSSKYKSFVIKFCQHHEAIDEYRIPYTFINEFIYYSKLNIGINLMEIDIFGIMGQFYGKLNLIDFEEIRKNENENYINKKDEPFQNIYLFSFDNFSEYYQKNLRAIINREQEDDKENFSKIRSINRSYKKYKRNNYFLSQKILNIYITFINNNLKELLKIFELTKWENEMTEEDKIQNSNELSTIKINYHLSKNEKLFLESGENKNEKIDYFYLILNQSNKKQTLKEKLFGTYTNIEISDVIEYNFIFNRYFSSYKLIKYSLLNVLAIASTFRNDLIDNLIIMKIICYFCDMTKLPAKKYLNIYLIIFQRMNQNQNIRGKFRTEECIKIISLYLSKTNMIPLEQSDNFLNELEIEIEEEHEFLNISSISESEGFKKLIKQKGNFFENKSEKNNFENAFKSIETIYLGKYGDDTFNFDYYELTKLSKMIKLNNDGNKFIPKIPILLYESTNKILKKYLRDFSNENIPYNELLEDILSLLFYFKIPNIGKKWIENKEAIFEENENLDDDENNLNEILKKIIALLFYLFNNIKTNKYK